MALLWMEGLEGGGATQPDMQEYITRRYALMAGNANMARNPGRFGLNCIRLKSNVYFGIPVSDKVTTITGFAFKIEGFTTGEAIVRWEDAGTLHVELQAVAGGELRLTRGTANVLGTTAIGLLTDTWYYIEVSLTIDDATGAYELRVNGVDVLSDTNVDTNNGANDYVTHIVFIGDDNAFKYYYDDIYVIDLLGGETDDFLGNMKITMYSPEADTGDADWTPLVGPANYEDVDDGTTVDDDTTYVTTGTDGDKDLYAYENAAPGATIRGVCIHTEYRITDADNFDLDIICKSNGTEYPNGGGQAGTADYVASLYLLGLDPDTASLWEADDLNASTFGFEAIDT